MYPTVEVLEAKLQQEELRGEVCLRRRQHRSQADPLLLPQAEPRPLPDFPNTTHRQR